MGNPAILRGVENRTRREARSTVGWWGGGPTGVAGRQCVGVGKLLYRLAVRWQSFLSASLPGARLARLPQYISRGRGDRLLIATLLLQINKIVQIFKYVYGKSLTFLRVRSVSACKSLEISLEFVRWEKQ